MAGGQLSQPVLKTVFICRPFAREEDESVEHHAPAYDWYVFQRLFEDYVDVAMHRGRVGDPPEVDPIGVDLRRVSRCF